MADRNPRILYLADRNILVDQPIEREYKPAFGDGETPIWKLQGEAKAGREIYFALYQALADGGDDPNGMFRQFAPDFFDLVDRRRVPPRQRSIATRRGARSSSTSPRRRSSA